MVGRKVVIVGSGFGGLAVARGLEGTDAEVTIIDRSNHHLFQPLLYQVATAALNPSDTATATRSLFSSSDNVRVLMDHVIGVDTSRSVVLTDQSGHVAYDFLVIATGADYSFFGHDEWAEHALVLKTMDDALTIRERVLAAFERAELEVDPAERARLLTFVVVGGGPTGVEMAGAIAELGRTTLAGDFRRIDPQEIRIILAEAGSRLLRPFCPQQSAHALKALAALGVEVKLGAVVQQIEDDGLWLGDGRIDASTIIWAAGTKARAAAKWIGAAAASNGGIIVDEHCRVPGHDAVFAIGDAASQTAADGSILPGLAPVAKQQGRHVARMIRAQLSHGRAPRPFRYHNWGMMAVIGRSQAVADFGWLKVNGLVAWLLWSMVHLFLLIDFRSRSSVYLSWSYAWFTHGRIARLLTRNDATTQKRLLTKEASS